MPLNFYYCKGDGFHAVIEEQNEKFATEYFVYLMNELLEPEKGITIKDVICEQVNIYKYKAAQQSVNADVMPCGHPLAESYQGADGGTYCRICESA